MLSDLIVMHEKKGLSIVLELHDRKNGTFITTFTKDKEPLYQKAIDEYGDDDLFIEDKAYDIFGRQVYTMKSLHCRCHKDLSKFWEVFNRINLRNIGVL